MLKQIASICISEAPGVVAVVSSAGSGKTYTLSTIYVTLLLNGVSIDSILGLTFTNKAVEELRNRILTQLMQLAFNEADMDFYSSVLNKDASSIRRKAIELLTDLLFNYSLFSVQTIDSFLNKLRLAFSFELKISSYSQIRRSVRQDMSLITALLLAEIEDNPSLKGPIERFIGYFSRALAIYKSWDPMNYMQKIFLKYLEQEIHNNATIKLSQIKPIYPMANLVLRLRDKFLLEVAKYDFELTERVKDSISKIKLQSLLQVKDITTRVLTKRSWDDFIKLFKKKSIKTNQEDLSACYQLWLDFLNAFTELEIAFSRNISQSFVELYSIFKKIVMRFQQENDIVYLNLITGQIAKLDPRLVAEKSVMRYGRFKYILIDEFQDTSLAQWKGLSPLIEESLSTGGLLFCVGDPKQTIYRWRGGVHGMFSILRSSFPSARYSQFILSKNWRSAREIVAFNNEMFSDKKEAIPLGKDSMLDTDLFNELYSVFSPEMVKQVSQKSFPGKVEILKVGVDTNLNSEQKRQTLIKELINFLNSKRSICKDFTFCVLVRRRSEAQEVISALLEEGIPVVSNESVTLVSSLLIKALVSFLRWINSPEQTSYLSMFIISPVWARISGYNVEYWEKELRFRQQDYFAELFESIVKRIRTESLYIMIKSIIDQFRLYDLFREEVFYLDAFLELVANWEAENSSLLDDFLQYWQQQEDALVDAEKLNLLVTPDTVRVMTIHGAKGLEFDIVIMPFLEVDFLRKYSYGFADQLVWDLEDEATVSPYYVNKTLALRNSRLSKLYARELTYRFWDNLNLVYVAFTRAKRQLILFVPETKGNDTTWAAWVNKAVA